MTDHSDIESLSFEQAQAQLEEIVEKLEDEHTGLDEALKLWERGEALHAFCQKKLDYAAARIEQLKVGQEEAAAVSAESGDDFRPVPAGELSQEPAAPEPDADGASEPVEPAEPQEKPLSQTIF